MISDFPKHGPRDTKKAEWSAEFGLSVNADVKLTVSWRFDTFKCEDFDTIMII